MAGRRSPSSQSISRLTSPHDQITSNYWRSRLQPTDRAELKQILTESIRWALTDTGAKPLRLASGTDRRNGAALAERSSLGVRELQPPLQLGLQDAVFGGQIFVPSQQLVSGRQFSHREIPPQRPYCMAGVVGLELANVAVKILFEMSGELLDFPKHFHTRDFSRGAGKSRMRITRGAGPDR
jgi:hypothetical protein